MNKILVLEMKSNLASQCVKRDRAVEILPKVSETEQPSSCKL